jgi:hypothetical protein
MRKSPQHVTIDHLSEAMRPVTNVRGVDREFD